MTTQNVSKLVSPLGVRARVAVLATRGGYMCRVPGSIGPPSPAFGILSSAWRHAADPQELLELLFYRDEPRARIARFDTSFDSLYRSIAGDFPHSFELHIITWKLYTRD